MKLLLHMCCGPCSVYPASVLSEEEVYFEGFFYNPNIHPYDEYIRRMENVDKFSKIKDIKVSYKEEFLQKTWEEFNGTEEKRCNMCYSVRLEQTAVFAAKNNFDAFTTTLLVSPFQKHDLIKSLGEEYGKKHGVEFYYRDFRAGFRQGQQQAKELGLYRQKFCGCIVSFNKSLKIY